MREQILEEINQASQNNQKKVKEIESQSTDDLGFIKERIQKLFPKPKRIILHIFIHSRNILLLQKL